MHDYPEHPAALANIFRLLSRTGRDAVMETACRVYMNEQGITEQDIRSLPHIRPLTHAKIDALFGGSAAPVDEATQRHNKRNVKISRSMTMRWAIRRAKADQVFQRFLQAGTTPPAKGRHRK